MNLNEWVAYGSNILRMVWVCCQRFMDTYCNLHLQIKVAVWVWMRSVNLLIFKISWMLLSIEKTTHCWSVWLTISTKVLLFVMFNWLPCIKSARAWQVATAYCFLWYEFVVNDLCILVATCTYKLRLQCEYEWVQST